MKLSMAVKILVDIKEKDDKFLTEKSETTAATLCSECHKNTHVGLVPFWHLYRRLLCDSCAKEYFQMLKEIGAINNF